VFWIALLVGLGFLVWLLSSILLPFVLGMAIAYLLDPLVAWLEKHGIRRVLASGGIIVGFFAVVSLLLLLVVPVVIEQLGNLAQRIPDLVVWVRVSLTPYLNRILVRFGTQIPALATPSADMVQKTVGFMGGVLTGLLTRGLAVVNVLALLGITPLVAFYLLRDWPKVIDDVDSWLPLTHAATVREQARKVDAVLAGFARGTAIVCLVQAAFYAVALTVMGLDFGLLIGITAGAISFVPYLGAIVGFVSAVGVALYQFWPSWPRVATVGAIFFIGQSIQDYVLVPRLVGDQVGLHPLWVIIGVLAGGSLFGFVGVLLAVPACAVIGVLVRFAIAQYKASELYRGGTE